MPVINGWTIRAHPLLLDQLEKLTASVDELARKNPEGYQETANAKLLAALLALMFDKVPQEPTSTSYLQGKTLGSERRHWFRAKFGAARFRLFFRYSSRAKVIIFAWVNDENTLRTYGSKTDAYAVFKEMLNNGNPPDDWEKLLKAASDDKAEKRLNKAYTSKVKNGIRASLQTHRMRALRPENASQIKPASFSPCRARSTSMIAFSPTRGETRPHCRRRCPDIIAGTFRFLIKHRIPSGGNQC
ncbi:type II toxin-antitoxin system YhaV family toxin [Rhizobium puerariae]|uniref:Type II toxin-antitoxin system YhaV family toxin n=1 Tax=Rhizobium puerariae TaxID=1585791 RepID=A0ABV6AL92_9HYPH